MAWKKAIEKVKEAAGTTACHACFHQTRSGLSGVCGVCVHNKGGERLGHLHRQESFKRCPARQGLTYADFSVRGQTKLRFRYRRRWISLDFKI